MDTLLLIKTIEKIYLSWGYLLVFLSSFIEISPFGFLIPGGLIISMGGFFAYGDKFALAGVILAGWLGMMTTLYTAYFLGKKTGLTLAKKLHQENFANQAKLLLKNQGPIILTTSLLANLTRFWIAYIAGAQNYSLLKFSFYASVASLTWNSLLVSIGFLAGVERQSLETGLARLGILAWGLVALAITTIYLKSKKEFSRLKSRSLN